MAEAEKVALAVSPPPGDAEFVRVHAVELEARPLPVPPARLPVRVALAQPDADRSGVLEAEGVLESDPEKDVVCVAVGVAEPELQPEEESVGDIDAVVDTLGEAEGAPEKEGAADAEGLSERELEKLPEPETEPERVVAQVPLGTAVTDGEPLAVAEPLVVGVMVVEPVVERDTAAG